MTGIPVGYVSTVSRYCIYLELASMGQGHAHIGLVSYQRMKWGLEEADGPVKGVWLADVIVNRAVSRWKVRYRTVGDAAYSI